LGKNQDLLNIASTAFNSSILSKIQKYDKSKIKNFYATRKAPELEYMTRVELIESKRHY
jgi:hypothetical protein